MELAVEGLFKAKFFGRTFKVDEILSRISSPCIPLKTFTFSTIILVDWIFFLGMNFPSRIFPLPLNPLFSSENSSFTLIFPGSFSSEDTILNQFVPTNSPIKSKTSLS
ncbi:hypothetical protein QTJ04_02210 [Clostridium perfringens]|nr:hypothetical protein [Clostridium perfringens]MDM1005062.1 hypothetical protein [Clostridium perfringens]